MSHVTPIAGCVYQMNILSSVGILLQEVRVSHLGLCDQSHISVILLFCGSVSKNYIQRYTPENKLRPYFNLLLYYNVLMLTVFFSVVLLKTKHFLMPGIESLHCSECKRFSNKVEKEQWFILSKGNLPFTGEENSFTRLIIMQISDIHLLTGRSL